MLKKLNNALLNSTKHLSLYLYIFNKIINESITIACYTRYIYIIDDLKIKFLIINNIIELKPIFFDVRKKKFIIKNCQKFIIKLIIINVECFVKRVTRFNNTIKILIKFKTTIVFKLREKKIIN